MNRAGRRRAIRRSALALLVLAAAGALSCSRGPRLPRELSFDGVVLERAAEWQDGEISGVVFVPPGEKLPLAGLQLGVLLSHRHTSGAELSGWVMEKYELSPVQRWHRYGDGEEVCKIGQIGTTRPMRVFMAVHVCRVRSIASACAEVDRQLTDAQVQELALRQREAWDEACRERLDADRPALDAILDATLAR